MRLIRKSSFQSSVSGLKLRDLYQPCMAQGLPTDCWLENLIIETVIVPAIESLHYKAEFF
jgi:hypothetical protein